MSDKKDLCKRITAIASLNGFRRKGNYWSKEGSVFIKTLNLQKSAWSDLYYINLNIDLKFNIGQGVFFRHLETVDNPFEISAILDFENKTHSESQRLEMFEQIVSNSVDILEGINTKEELHAFVLRYPLLQNMMRPSMRNWLGLASY